MKNASAPVALDQGIVVPAALASGAQVRLRLLDLRRHYSLRAKPARIDAVAAAAHLVLPRRIGDSVTNGAIDALCLGPDEWLLIVDPSCDIERKFAAAPPPFSLVDISHRHVAFRLEGERAAALLNVGCPLDLEIAAFPVGKATRTVFERAEVLLIRRNNHAFDIEIWRSFAPYVLAVFAKNVDG